MYLTGVHGKAIVHAQTHTHTHTPPVVTARFSQQALSTWYTELPKIFPLTKEVKKNSHLSNTECVEENTHAYVSTSLITAYK